MDHILQLGDARIDSAKLAELCKRYGVKELSLFGSAARGEMGPQAILTSWWSSSPVSALDS